MARQLDIRFSSHHNDKRTNTKRKPNNIQDGVSHRTRPRFGQMLPVHITVRMARHVYNLRSQRYFSTIDRALNTTTERFGMRIVQFSLQRNHMHLVIETTTNGALSRTMQGLAIRITKRLNHVMYRHKHVFADRYHTRPLRTPTKIQQTLTYMHDNFAHHTGKHVTHNAFASPHPSVPLPTPTT